VNASPSVVAAALRARDSFILTSHARPDGDAIGSSMALALALEQLHKRVRVVLRDPVPAPYLAFPGLERIERTDRVTGTADALVVLECSDLNRPEVTGLDGFFTVNVDHHVGNTMYGAINWFDESAAACGEMVADVIDALGVVWTREIAAHLYLAISTDTGGLRYGPISTRTFETCRRIAASGIDTPTLSRQIFDSFSVGRVKLTGAILNAMELHHRDRLAILSLDDELLRRVGATTDDTEGLVNLPLAAKEILAVAMLKRQADGAFRVSFRSKGAVDVRAAAAHWGGGGHHNAAGCTIPGEYAAVRDAVVARLEEVIAGAEAARA
jgi:bifunctional oligoribonuclease and PAP phosphatase NrnA